ncbi:7347_t:CDS:2 [Entrophospora sp. SA101]|nr:7347_t:CDS:2 [Entrophospora sp. SA101]
MQNAIAKLVETWKRPGTIASTQTVTGQLGVLKKDNMKKKRAANGEAFKESEFDSLEVNILVSKKAANGEAFKESEFDSLEVNIAFLEYEADHKATVAKDVLNGFKITHDKEMKVILARR